jgi:hypothetical protein
MLFVHDTYLIINWQGAALLAIFGLLAVVLVAGILFRRIRSPA